MICYEEYLKFYKDFPKPGINFIDIVPLLQNKRVFSSLIKDLGKMIGSSNVAAPEARGFLFASPLLLECEHINNIIPFRKIGKLPHSNEDLVKIPIKKEYGEDIVCFRKSDIASGENINGTFHLSIFDDILATGGTARGIAETLESTKIKLDDKIYDIKIDEFVFVCEIEVLKGRGELEKTAPVKSLIKLKD